MLKLARNLCTTEDYSLEPSTPLHSFISSQIPLKLSFVEDKKICEDQRWHYKFLGGCDIHGMMEGEAIGELLDQKLSDRVFELR